MTRECLVANANKNRMNRKAHLQDKVDVSMDKKQVDQQQQDWDYQVSVQISVAAWQDGEDLVSGPDKEGEQGEGGEEGGEVEEGED